MSRTALIYLRKSKVSEDRPGFISHEKQTNLTHELAERHGYPPGAIREWEDWGKSGAAGKEHKRPNYLAMRAVIEAVPPLPTKSGVYTAPEGYEPPVEIFAYDQSRITRSIKEWADLATLCTERGIPVHLVHGGTTDFLSATGRLVQNVLISISAFIVETSREHKAETDAMKLDNNIKAGRPEREGMGGRDIYPDLDLVVSAKHEAGSFHGAAALLNKRGVPSPDALRYGRPTHVVNKVEMRYQWTATTVQRLVERVEPRTNTVVKRNPGSKDRAEHPFTGLLRCPCGGTLTSMGGTNRAPSYVCGNAKTDKSHSHPYQISERRVIAFLDPIINAKINSDEYTVAAEASAEVSVRHSEIEQERARIKRLATLGLQDVDEARRILDALDAREQSLAAAVEFASLPFPLVKHDVSATSITVGDRIDWRAPVSDLNRSLRIAIEYVPLDLTFTPGQPVWRLDIGQEESAS